MWSAKRTALFLQKMLDADRHLYKLGQEFLDVEDRQKTRHFEEAQRRLWAAHKEWRSAFEAAKKASERAIGDGDMSMRGFTAKDRIK
jgi:hypothetical protein